MVMKRPSEDVGTMAPPKEEDFPRGGGGALTSLERRQAREEGRTRAERELNEGSRPVKKRKGASIAEVQRLERPTPSYAQETSSCASGAAMQGVMSRGSTCSIRQHAGFALGAFVLGGFALEAFANCMQDGEDTFFAREALQGHLPKYVELLKFKVSIFKSITLLETNLV